MQVGFCNGGGRRRVGEDGEEKATSILWLMFGP